MKNYNYFIYKMVNLKFIKTLEEDRLKINELEAIPSPQHQDVEDLCYDITRILWWQIENDMLNLHDREDEMYFFSFVDLLFRFHDIIGFDENEIYRDDKYELPFEIILPEATNDVVVLVKYNVSPVLNIFLINSSTFKIILRFDIITIDCG